MVSLLSTLLHSCFLFAIVTLVGSTNWAQTTGKTAQNVVVPRRPSPDHRHWSERYGAAVVLAREPDDPFRDAEDPDSEEIENVIYLLGGDSYDNDHTVPDEDSRQPAMPMGYKNDVWKSTGTEWLVDNDNRIHNEYDESETRVESKMEWEEVTPGLLPPPGTTYDHWLRCERIGGVAPTDPTCEEDVNQYNVHWSPRRNLGATYMNGYIWVMGGRAREIARLPEDDAIGGIMTPRISDIPQPSIGVNFDQKFTTQREVSTYKSDVWRSRDGETWELVTPGCRAPQSNLISKGNEAEGKAGTKENACTSAEDCNGAAEECVAGTCECQMWSPRERHQVLAYNKKLYVVGGFASLRFNQRSNCGAYACGDVDAGSYRHYMQDIWRSADGEIWESINLGNLNTSFPGRGSHQAIIMRNYVDDLETRIYVIGGEGGDATTNEITYFNDMWWARIDFPDEWFEYTDVNMSWPARGGHTAILEPRSALNDNNRMIYIMGGVNHNGVLSDTWMWRPDVPGDIWRQDYESEAIFRSAEALSHGGLYAEDSPTIHYISPDSDIDYLIKWWIPQPGFTGISDPGLRSEARVLLDDHKLSMLHSVGITTIRELAEADKYVILKLRGHDFPGVEEVMDFTDICDLRALAVAAVDKCTIVTDRYFYDGEFGMPWNNEPEFGGPPPERLPAEWHNRDFLDMQESDDPDVWIDEWDGCEILPLNTKPNVNGLGKVTQVESIRDPRKEVQELHCKYNPGPRAYHSALFFEERMYIFGGRVNATHSRADSWYRDDRMPAVSITLKPESETDDYRFRFAADEGGCVFEYRIWDHYRYKEIRPWTPVRWFTHVDWLDWRKGGPGNGNYVLYVRAIDPSGNRDERYVLGRNMHHWRYISPTPWDIIFGCIAAFLFMATCAYLEYRRRVKKAAMERYAMKRMRRKFKAMQRDTDGRAVDWRTLYSEHKELKEDDADGKKRARDMKKKREKAKAQREKDKNKRDKEKEKIRKKLKDKEKKRNAENTTVVAAPAITNGKDSNSDKKAIAGDGPGAMVVKTSKNTDAFGDEGSGAGKFSRGKSNRFKNYEIDDSSKKSGKLSAITDGSSLKRGKSNKFKEYEIDDKPSKGGGGKLPAITDGDSLKRGKSNKFKDYEIDDKSSAGGGGGKGNKFKEYEIGEKDKKV